MMEWISIPAALFPCFLAGELSKRSSMAAWIIIAIILAFNLMPDSFSFDRFILSFFAIFLPLLFIGSIKRSVAVSS